MTNFLPKSSTNARWQFRELARHGEHDGLIMFVHKNPSIMRFAASEIEWAILHDDKATARCLLNLFNEYPPKGGRPAGEFLRRFSPGQLEPYRKAHPEVDEAISWLQEKMEEHHRGRKLVRAKDAASDMTL